MIVLRVGDERLTGCFSYLTSVDLVGIFGVKLVIYC